MRFALEFATFIKADLTLGPRFDLYRYFSHLSFQISFIIIIIAIIIHHRTARTKAASGTSSYGISLGQWCGIVKTYELRAHCALGWLFLCLCIRRKKNEYIYLIYKIISGSKSDVSGEKKRGGDTVDRQGIEFYEDFELRCYN